MTFYELERHRDMIKEPPREYSASDTFALIAGIVVFCVVACWLGLWAINKPVHPFACDNFRGAECAAAVMGRG